MRCFACLLMSLTCLASTPLLARGEAGSRPELFDPERHMRVSEVKPGMKGYGLSVFRGTKIERFEVEVLSVLRNFNPKRDVILITCRGANLEHTGAIAGMSGSPIYLVDEQGRERMIGAFAYGWAMLKDPLAGVQPIEYMLEMPHTYPKVMGATQPSEPGGGSGAPAASAADAQQRSAGPARWSLLEVVPLPGQPVPDAFPFASLDSLAPNPRHFMDLADGSRMQHLSSPLMVAGVPSSVLDAYAPVLRRYGLVAMQSGGSGGSPRPDAETVDVAFAPGSVMAVPLITGDIDFTAIGTVTEVVGGLVFGFGHPFVAEGPVTLPMGTGEINGVLARLDQSMKLGSLLRLRGTLTGDHTVGVAGSVGDSPATAPIEIRVRYADGSQDETYRYQCAIHPRFTPLLGAMAVSAAMSGMRELPQHHTLDYDLTLEFGNGQILRMSDVAINGGPAWPLRSIVLPVLAATENPFERITVKRITGTVNVIAERRDAEILSVNLPRLKYKPGETVRAFVHYRPFRAAEAILPVELQLPGDLSDGTYQLVIAGWERFMIDEMMAQPFRFTAENSQQVFEVLRDVASRRHDALYVRLLRQPDGVAVGRVAMPRLPSSRRQVLLASGRSNTTPFVSSTVKVIPTRVVMNGGADFAIEIDADERVETAVTRTSVIPSTDARSSKTGKIELPREQEKAGDREKPDADKPEKSETPRPEAPGEHDRQD
jgi:hypothetical protein